MYTNDAECYTCIHHTAIDSQVVCAKHGRALPYPNADCLICRDWLFHKDPNDAGEYYKEHYFTESGKLYRYNTYFIKDRKVLCEIADLPPIPKE